MDSAKGTVEFTYEAGIPCAESASTWSFIKEIKGEIITVP